MSMLDGIIGNVLGGMLGSNNSSAQQNPLLQAALQILQQNGGIGGIVERFRQSGYAAQADSWVSTGQNQPIGADAPQQVLGSGALRDLEAKLGAAPGSAAGALASILPQMIDQMTPQGKIPDEQSDPVAQALAMLNARRAG